MITCEHYAFKGEKKNSVPFISLAQYLIGKNIAWFTFALIFNCQLENKTFENLRCTFLPLRQSQHDVAVVCSEKFAFFFLFLPHVQLYQHGYTVSMNTYFNPCFYRTKENPIQRTISSFLVLGTPVFFTVTKNQKSGLMICLKYFHLSFGKLLLFCIKVFMPKN